MGSYICKYVKTHNIKPKDAKAYSLLKSLISQSDLVFNFNYTKTLEDHFNIDKNKVIHIHNSLEYPILGHDDKERISKENNSEQYKYYCIFVNGTTKDTIGQFNGCENKFINAHISKIIFIGVSYSKVDWPYFKYIKNTYGSIQPNCQCILYYHSSKDVHSARDFRNYLYKNKIISNLDNIYLTPDH